MWSKRSIVIALVTCLLGVILAGFPSSPAKAFSTNPNDYYSYTYTFTFSKTTVAAGESFSVTVSGQATCIQDLPVSVSARISSKIIGRLQSGYEVVLNPDYSLSYSDIPRKKGEVANISVQVSLVFPVGSASGNYTVIGQILEAKATALGIITIDVKGSIPSQQVMGTVTCTESGSGSGGGGGGGAPILGPYERGSMIDLTKYQNKDGEMTEDVEVSSTDSRLKLEIYRGVKITLQGIIASGVAIIEMDKAKEPRPPAGGFIIGKTYDLGPTGATFSQPIRLVFSFDPSSLPANVKKKDLAVAWWSEGDSKWIPLKDYRVDETTNTASGTIDHFTIFGIIAVPALEPTTVAVSPSSTPSIATPTISPTIQPSTSPVSTPGAGIFSVGDINITPRVPKAGEQVAIEVVVLNSGSTAGAYTVTLSIDGLEKESRSVTIGANSSEQTSFIISSLIAGKHSVTVDNKSLDFSVGAAESLQEPVNWRLVAAFVSAGILAGIAIAVAIRKSVGARGRL